MRKYKISLNSDEDHVRQIKEGLASNDGYCPCRIGRLPENKCMCQEFKDQLKDDNFEGLCHCGLYLKQFKE
jgi:ferredoxin-thioredoxin reductase catalytic subunit